uniref:Stress responsive gene 6 protein, Srg6 n=1 Tax=Hordeum vulgare TaxID=4513 RepID=Q8VWH9_HORVU|nr:stress responsive gene 6 protein, Srg6 [Hordeum vulgare subsp. vulgare]CAC20595.1 stress responsive gene 6, Srg6 [Hordeum vulgare subsp. vulgare]
MADHAADEQEPPVLLERAARATRGKRITKLVEEEVENDEAFWGQDALKEDEEDDNYQEEQDAGDVFDSDFDEDVRSLLLLRPICSIGEPQPDDDPEKEVSERLPIKKRLVFPGKTMKKMKAKKKKKKNKFIKLEDDDIDDKAPDKTTSSKQSDVPDEWESEKTIRKSTRTAVIVRQAEREAIRAEKQATAKPIKKRKEGEEKRMTQEEMLLEAAETEIMNMRNLERVLAREEEVKKKAVVQKAVYEGPTLRFHSRDGESRLEFINGASFGSELCTTSTPYPEKSVCVVTGLPAKYRDPKTGLPYATMAAFKIIRERFLKEEPDKKRPNMSNMGELFESVAGEHSTPKKKRIEGRSPISVDLRHGGRFRRIPALDVMDED